MAKAKVIVAEREYGNVSVTRGERRRTVIEPPSSLSGKSDESFSQVLKSCAQLGQIALAARGCELSIRALKSVL
jgi:hypothetical protein